MSTIGQAHGGGYLAHTLSPGRRVFYREISEIEINSGRGDLEASPYCISCWLGIIQAADQD